MKITKKEVFIIIALIVIAIVRFFFFLPKPADYGIGIGKEVSVTGFVALPPDIRLTSKRLTINPTNQDSNILAIVPRNIEVSYGDIVAVKGTLETPQNFLATSGKEFNYERYLANQDIYFVIKNATIEVVARNTGNPIKSWLYKLRDKFMGNIGLVINPPESDLADGLLLGARGGFDNDMRNEFITTGTIHIIALSGYNVTVVAEGVMKVLGLVLAETLSIVFGIVMIILFIIMAGASSTAIRAGVMATIALTARMTGRKYDAGRALVIAALVMIAYDLRVLTDISFQLSFLATGGVLFLTPKTISWIRFIPMKFGMRELVATTLGAMIAVLPLLLYATGIFSIVALPANILILPVIPITMFMSFLVGILGFVSSSIALPFAYIAHVLLLYILSIIHFFASLPLASVNIKSFPLIFMITMYTLIIYWVWGKPVDRKKKKSTIDNNNKLVNISDLRC